MSYGLIGYKFHINTNIVQQSAKKNNDKIFKDGIVVYYYWNTIVINCMYVCVYYYLSL